MPKAKRKAVASKAGKTAHLLGKAHTWTSMEASLAGKKGGAKSKRRQ